MPDEAIVPSDGAPAMGQRNEIIAASFSGPLPPPALLSQYQELGLLEDVMKLARDANERCNKELAIRESQQNAKNALYIAQAKDQVYTSLTQNITYVLIVLAVILIMLALIGITCILTWQGKYWSASLSFIISLVFPGAAKFIFASKRS